MAFYNVSTTQGSSQQIADIPAGESTTFIIYNPTSVSSYFTLETIRNSSGFYDPNSPRNTSGSFTLGPNLSNLIKSDYIASVVIDSSTYANLTFIPATYISASTLFLRGTGPAGTPTWGQAIIDSYISRASASGSVQQNLSCVSSSLATTPYIESASWVLVPSAIEEDVVLAEVPNTGLGDLTFTRASDATYTDSTGVVRRSPYNLLTFSEDLSNVAWFTSNTTITANTTTAPNGTLTADTLTGNGTSNLHTVLQSANAINGITYTHSVYAKKGTNNFIQLIGGAAIYTSGLVFANFDLNNGVVGSVGAGTTATITNVGNGWYRCTITATATATVTGSAFIPCLISSATSLRGESNSLSTSVFLWGAQLVEGTSALDYFPTTNRQDVPRIDFRNADGTLSSCGRLLLEPQRTNSIRNSSMVGAVAGSPGTIPTNWTQSGGGGLTTTISLGTESGLPYVDIRYNGTATQTFIELRFEGTTAIAALTAQTWTASSYLKAISGTIPTSQLTIIERTAAGGFITQGSTLSTPTSTLQRFTLTRTLSGGATVAFVQPLILFSLTIGATYDFTIRIAAPQMELGAYATTWVPTTTAAVTRIADAASKTGVSSLIGQTEGTVFLDLNYQAITGLSMFISIRPNSTNKIEVYRDGTSIFGDVLGNNVSVVLSRVANPAGQYKIALAYKSGQTALYINGTSVGTSTTAFSFAVSMADLFLNLRSGPTFVEQTFYNQAALFPTRLTNAQLAQLTTL
jgi:hypothetical protein